MDPNALPLVVPPHLCACSIFGLSDCACLDAVCACYVDLMQLVDLRQDVHAALASMRADTAAGMRTILQAINRRVCDYVDLYYIRTFLYPSLERFSMHARAQRQGAPSVLTSGSGARCASPALATLRCLYT